MLLNLVLEVAMVVSPWQRGCQGFRRAAAAEAEDCGAERPSQRCPRQQLERACSQVSFKSFTLDTSEWLRGQWTDGRVCVFMQEAVMRVLYAVLVSSGLNSPSSVLKAFVFFLSFMSILAPAPHQEPKQPFSQQSEELVGMWGLGAGLQRPA